MKYIVASFLILVGSCATLRHSEKVKNLKESIVFYEKDTVQKYLNTINPKQLETIVDEVSSDKYMGRLTGEKGHNDVCDYLRNYYKNLGITAPGT
ncbi:MAG: peptidase M28, partial [Bacteroidia bacterium]|nr:peptidase M28 [Bacteroidia bacterium]